MFGVNSGTFLGTFYTNRSATYAAKDSDSKSLYN